MSLSLIYLRECWMWIIFLFVFLNQGLSLWGSREGYFCQVITLSIWGWSWISCLQLFMYFYIVFFSVDLSLLYSRSFIVSLRLLFTQVQRFHAPLESHINVYWVSLSKICYFILTKILEESLFQVWPLLGQLLQRVLKCKGKKVTYLKKFKLNIVYFSIVTKLPGLRLLGHQWKYFT